jgi:pterin-4a-carbinolamine dehydratase
VRWRSQGPDRQRTPDHHAPRLSGWKLAQNKLSRTFEFQDFVQSLSFGNSLVAYFEIVDPHPDVRIAYGEVTFELTRSQTDDCRRDSNLFLESARNPATERRLYVAVTRGFQTYDG